MKRRWLGVLIVTVAVLAVLVSRGLQPRRLAGSPQAISPPGPPSVGDCVPDQVNPATWPTGHYDYPHLQFHACDGFRFGEVVAVLTNPAEPSSTTESGPGGSVGDTNPYTCLVERIRTTSDL